MSSGIGPSPDRGSRRTGPRAPRESEIWEALRFVEDPDLGIDIVNLGLVYEVLVEGATARLRMTLTSIGCPAAEFLEVQVKEAVGAVQGVKQVEVEWTFDPPWSPERISEEGRDLLIVMGYL